MMQVGLMNPNEVTVPVNYYRRDCMGGPFAGLRNSGPYIAPFFNPEDLVRLLSPPLDYAERKMIMIWGPLMLVLLMMSITGVFIYYQIVAVTYSVYYTVQVVYGCTTTVLVILYLTWFFCWQSKFVRRLRAYLDELNRGTLAPYGLTLFYTAQCEGSFRYRGGLITIRRGGINDMSSMRPVELTYINAS